MIYCFQKKKNQVIDRLGGYEHEKENMIITSSPFIFQCFFFAFSSFLFFFGEIPRTSRRRRCWRQWRSLLCFFLPRIFVDRVVPVSFLIESTLIAMMLNVLGFALNGSFFCLLPFWFGSGEKGLPFPFFAVKNDLYLVYFLIESSVIALFQRYYFVLTEIGWVVLVF